MLTRLVRPRVVAMFDAVSRGDDATVLAGLAADVEHRFAGDHPLAGVRVGRSLVAQWLERLHRLFPGLAFDVGTVSVSGPPWNLLVTAQWVAAVTPAAGAAYRNHRAHVIRLVRGRAVSVHAYEDSQAVAAACAVMLAAGIDEAGAVPIGSPTGQ